MAAEQLFNQNRAQSFATMGEKAGLGEALERERKNTYTFFFSPFPQFLSRLSHSASPRNKIHIIADDWEQFWRDGRDLATRQYKDP